MAHKKSLHPDVKPFLTGVNVPHLDGRQHLDSEQEARERNYRIHHFRNARETGRTSIWQSIADAAQLVGDSLVNAIEKLYSRRSGLDTPPGYRLNIWAETLYPKKTYERVFAPLIADVQAEYIEALDQGRRGKAQWIRWRGRAAFWTAVFARVPDAFTTWVKTALKLAGS